MIILIIYFVSISNIRAHDFLPNYKKTELSMKISSVFQSNAEQVMVELYLFPKNTGNQDISLSTDPDSEITDDTIKFEFDKTGTLDFEVNAEIEREILIKKVGKVTLSEAKFPEGLEEYTESEEYVLADDPFIKNKAQQLATNDAFETLYNLAEYVRKNMEYNTSYQEIMDASWVMQEKKGVCSHYTILFMSLARSLGLATRYVSGVAYSNKENKCREHAWAEVWLPEYGWVPFDTTFRQYSWLDSSHVELMQNTDAGSASISYRYLGEIETGKLKIDTEIIETGEEFVLPLDIELSPLTDKISTDSFLPLKVKIKNPYNYYLTVPVRVSLAPGVFGENEKIILLKPYSEAFEYFIIYIDPENYENCQDSCIATLEVRDVFENFDNAIVKFEKGATKITISEAQKFASVHEENVDFYCKVGDEYYYGYEEMEIECVVTNRESKKELSICNKNICEEFIIDMDESKSIVINIPVSLIENDTENNEIMKCLLLCVTAKEKRDVISISCIETVILEEPEIKIAILQNTETDYGSEGNLQAVLESNMLTSAELIIETDSYTEKQNLSIEKNTQVVEIPIKTWELGIGDNPVRVTIKYKDKRYKEYETKKEFLYTVRDVNIFKKILTKIVHLFD